tara:strand:+ start:485 stop:2449 length:1965 start_codon:yes stop_codon:yes gene_type:complete
MTVIPKKRKKIDKDRIDNYYWIKDNKQSITPYLNNLNNEIDTLIDMNTINILDNEFKSRVLENYSSYPYHYNKYYYYTRLYKNKNYIKLFRFKNSIDQSELLLDCNKLSKNFKYFDLGDYDISISNKILLYTIDTKGDESYSLYLKNLELEETYLINDNICPNILWINNNKYVYIKFDSNRRPFQVCIHYIKSNKHEIIYDETDEKFIVSIYKSSDNKYFFINSVSKTSNEIYYMTRSFRECILVQKRTSNLLYTVEHNDNFLYILTNHNFSNFKVMVTPINKTEITNWSELLKFKSVIIDEMLMFNNYIVLNCKRKGLSEINIYDFKVQNLSQIKYDSINYLSLYINDFNSDYLIYKYSSIIQPTIYLEYNMKSNTNIVKKEDIIANYDPDEYAIERIKINNLDLYATICYNKKLFKLDGNSKGFLYGYGSYGITIEYTFNKYIISLLDRGFIYIIAHVRGGGYLGQNWYKEGKLEKKMNSFSDFIEISEYLINNNYVDKNNLFINGGSAGGLLIGAVINMRPDLYNSAILDVPFLDCLTTMLDSSLPLTIGEYEEWGNPQYDNYYEYILSYSPMDNIKKQYYPNILLTTSLNDTHVGFWEPVKYYAKLKDYNLNSQVFLKINLEAGHQSTSERYEFLREVAFKYVFILSNVV